MRSISKLRIDFVETRLRIDGNELENLHQLLMALVKTTLDQFISGYIPPSIHPLWKEPMLISTRPVQIVSNDPFHCITIHFKKPPDCFDSVTSLW